MFDMIMDVDRFITQVIHKSGISLNDFPKNLIGDRNLIQRISFGKMY